jgi:hypothetical protein
MNKVYVLYGIDEYGVPLCMFFPSIKDRDNFRELLSDKGTYGKMTLNGIDYDDFELELEP